MKKKLLAILVLNAMVFASNAFAVLTKHQMEEVREKLSGKFSTRAEVLRGWHVARPHDSGAAAAVSDVDIADHDDETNKLETYWRVVELTDGTKVEVFMEASTNQEKEDVLAAIRGKDREHIGGFLFVPNSDETPVQVDVKLGDGADE